MDCQFLGGLAEHVALVECQLDSVKQRTKNTPTPNNFFLSFSGVLRSVGTGVYECIYRDKKLSVSLCVFVPLHRVSWHSTGFDML
jgi:hypothetical protein